MEGCARLETSMPPPPAEPPSFVEFLSNYCRIIVERRNVFVEFLLNYCRIFKDQLRRKILKNSKKGPKRGPQKLDFFPLEKCQTPEIDLSYNTSKIRQKSKIGRNMSQMARLTVVLAVPARDLSNGAARWSSRRYHFSTHFGCRSPYEKPR